MASQTTEALLNPYSSVTDKQVWKTAVASHNAFNINDIWTPKYDFGPTDTFTTYGSCFAQHFSRSLLSRGLNWVNTEPAPDIMGADNAFKYGYGIYSSRTQNIYTPTMLLQWLQMGLDTRLFIDEIWVQNNRCFDPIRPTVEPNGFDSEQEMLNARRTTINSFIESIKQASVFVFTLGLTERWINSKSQMEYSICPGTAAGQYDKSLHQFDNLSFDSLRHALEQVIEMLRNINPSIKILLTVSPVPLVATYQDKHVLVSTIGAKSALRAVTDVVSLGKDYVDYFPSFEIISSFPFKGMFYEPNMRSVNPTGVEFVMNQFYTATKIKPNPQMQTTSGNYDTQCEEELLAAFT